MIKIIFRISATRRNIFILFIKYFHWVSVSGYDHKIPLYERNAHKLSFYYCNKPCFPPWYCEPRFVVSIATLKHLFSHNTPGIAPPDKKKTFLLKVACHIFQSFGLKCVLLTPCLRHNATPVDPCFKSFCVYRFGINMWPEALPCRISPYLQGAECKLTNSYSAYLGFQSRNALAEEVQRGIALIVITNNVFTILWIRRDLLLTRSTYNYSANSIRHGQF